MSRILVLTNSYDNSHVNAVSAHLSDMGHVVVRLDIDVLLRGEQSITWDYQSGNLSLDSDDQRINLLEMDSIWFRKPFGFGPRHGFAESIHDPVQRTMVEKEVRDIVNGLCSVLGSKLWINHPKRINQARLKPYQLHVAKTVGIDIPDSIITNDPEEARLFCSGGSTIFKALSEQGLDYGDVVRSINTTLITDKHIEQLGLIRSQPILLQRYVKKSAELRVTCVGDEVFVARQTLTGNSDVADWRLLQGTDTSKYAPWKISPELTHKVQSLVRGLKLRFAAIDFAVDRNDQIWFLEINPNGQWLGYTEEIGMPAALSLARLLAP